MNGNRALIDSNVVIDLVLNRIKSEFILNQFDQIAISFITYIEVLGYNFKSEQEKSVTIHLIKHLEVIYPNEIISDLVINYRKINKIKIPDAIILATARYCNIPLITSNIDDFIKLDQNVIVYKPERI